MKRIQSLALLIYLIKLFIFKMEVDVADEVYDIRRARSRFSLQCGDVYNEFVELNNAFSGNLKTFYLRNGDENIKDLCFFANHS